MSNFVNLRLILQDNRPDFRKFKEELSRDELKKGDLDLLLRKLVDCKVPDFQLFCDVLVKYDLGHLGREPMSTSPTPKVHSSLLKITSATSWLPAKKGPCRW